MGPEQIRGLAWGWIGGNAADPNCKGHFVKCSTEAIEMFVLHKAGLLTGRGDGV